MVYLKTIVKVQKKTRLMLISQSLNFQLDLITVNNSKKKEAESVVVVQKTLCSLPHMFTPHIYYTVSSQYTVCT